MDRLRMRMHGFVAGAALMLAVWMLGLTGHAQPPFGPVSITAQDVAGNCGTVGSCAVFPLPTTPDVAIDISGTWTGTLSLEGAPDGVNFVPMTMFSAATGAAVTSVTSNATVQNPAGNFSQIRVHSTAAMTGTALVVGRRTPATSTTFDSIIIGQVRISSEQAGILTFRSLVGNSEDLRLDLASSADLFAFSSSTGAAIFDTSSFKQRRASSTLTVDGATTVQITRDHHVLACTGPESINTITGGSQGMLLILQHTDTDCTLVDDDDPTATNAIDLTGSANDVGAVGKVIVLLFTAGSTWLEVTESDN